MFCAPSVHSHSFVCPFFLEPTWKGLSIQKKKIVWLLNLFIHSRNLSIIILFHSVSIFHSSNRFRFINFFRVNLVLLYNVLSIYIAGFKLNLGKIRIWLKFITWNELNIWSILFLRDLEPTFIYIHKTVHSITIQCYLICKARRWYLLTHTASLPCTA